MTNSRKKVVRYRCFGLYNEQYWQHRQHNVYTTPTMHCVMSYFLFCNQTGSTWFDHICCLFGDIRKIFSQDVVRSLGKNSAASVFLWNECNFIRKTFKTRSAINHRNVMTLRRQQRTTYHGECLWIVLNNQGSKEGTCKKLGENIQNLAQKPKICYGRSFSRKVVPPVLNEQNLVESPLRFLFWSQNMKI